MELRAFEQFVDWPAVPHAMFGVELMPATATLDRPGACHA